MDVTKFTTEEKVLIENTIEDLVINFLYYDRKNDEDFDSAKIAEFINRDKEEFIKLVTDKFNYHIEKGVE